MDLASIPLSLTLAVNTSKVALLFVAIVILLVFSSFFSSAETAYTSLNRIRLKTMANNGSRRASKVLEQLEDYDKILTTVLVGNTTVNIVLTTLAGILFAELIKSNQAVAAIVSTVVVTFIVLIFGEIFPKSIAKENAEKFAIFAQPIMAFTIIVFSPFILIFNIWRKIYKPKKVATVTEDELITIVEEAESGGEIDKHESQLIRSAIEFDDVELYDIMVPRVKIKAIRSTEDLEAIAQVFINSGFSRLPVYSDSLDSIIGIIHEKDFHALQRQKKKDIKEILKDSLWLSANMKISDALRVMQHAKVHMAIVADEFGGTSGLVTMEDILEELVGEIYDEHDEEEELIKQIDENKYIVSGAENLEDMFEEINVELDDEFDSTTVGGWVTEQLKCIPLVGEIFEYKNLKITITKASARIVEEVEVVIKTGEEELEK